jgi:hypothetical protein
MGYVREIVKLIFLFQYKQTKCSQNTIFHLQNNFFHRKFLISMRRNGPLNIILNENAVFWDVPPCGSSRNRRFGGT